MIYFIHAPEVNALKIGLTNDHLRRLCMLQTGSPCELVLLAVIEGGKAQERDLHSRFAAQRTRGEWFSYDGELRAYVESLPKFEKPSRGPTIDAMAAAAGMSRSYVAMLRSGQRGKLPVLLHLYRTTGWKHPSLQNYSDETIAGLAAKIPWKSQRKQLSDADARVAARIHGEQ